MYISSIDDSRNLEIAKVTRIFYTVCIFFFVMFLEKVVRNEVAMRRHWQRDYEWFGSAIIACVVEDITMRFGITLLKLID